MWRGKKTSRRDKKEKKGGDCGACNYSFWFSGLLAWPDSSCDWS